MTYKPVDTMEKMTKALVVNKRDRDAMLQREKALLQRVSTLEKKMWIVLGCALVWAVCFLQAFVEHMEYGVDTNRSAYKDPILLLLSPISFTSIRVCNTAYHGTFKMIFSQMRRAPFLLLFHIN